MPNGQKLKKPALNNYYLFAFLIFSVAILVFFLFASNRLVKQLASQEKERMDIWAQATQQLAIAEAQANVDFLLEIIRGNNFIPVLVADSSFRILDYRNFTLPERTSENIPYEMLSDRNKDFLQDRLYLATGGKSLEEAALTNHHFIKVDIQYQIPQYVYYEDSVLLKRLGWYPYVELGVVIIISLILFIAIIYAKNAEQNRLWAGLSKETAHQLGTPISSLLAWSQYLENSLDNKEVALEIHKDVGRLSTIAERFSKIGSDPELLPEDINTLIEHSLNYMRSRISSRVKITVIDDNTQHFVNVSAPLFEWVMENLIKNAVDAMNGEGEIDISSGEEDKKVWIEIQDTGKGIQKKNFKKVFSPGYTTKKRGWGLGLTLVKRIIEKYHGGKIYVKRSEPGHGTTFRIELPAQY